jgi:hypothetical protein
MPKSRPEALRAVRFLEIPAVRRREQATACEVGALSTPVVRIVGGGREDSVHTRSTAHRGVNCRALARAQRADQRRPWPRPAPSQRRREQDKTRDAFGIAQTNFECDPSAEVAADEVSAFDIEVIGTSTTARAKNGGWYAAGGRNRRIRGGPARCPERGCEEKGRQKRSLVALRP